MKTLLKFLLSFSFLFTIFFSCNKKEFEVDNIPIKSESSIIAGDYESENYKFHIKEGTLIFKDIESFKEIKNDFAKKTEQERVNFFVENGFLSYLYHKNKFKAEVEKLKTENEFHDLQNLYQEILNQDDKNLFTSEDNLINTFLNKEGMFYIGKVLYHFKNNEETIVLDGDKQKIDSKPSKIVLKFKTNSVESAKNKRPNNGSCLSIYKVGYNAPDYNRKIDIWTEAVKRTYSNGNNFDIEIQWHVYTKAYKWSFWGYWNEYTTFHHFYGQGNFNLQSGATGENFNDILSEAAHFEAYNGPEFWGPNHYFSNIQNPYSFYWEFNLSGGQYWTRGVDLPGVSFTCW